MEINGMLLPCALVSAMESGIWKLRRFGVEEDWLNIDLKDIKKLFPDCEYYAPGLFDLEQMIRETKAINSTKDQASWYIGKIHSNHHPGRIDPEFVVFVGGIEPDSPIALDYRAKITEPTLIYLTEIDYQPCWMEATGSIEDLIDILIGKQSAVT